MVPFGTIHDNTKINHHNYQSFQPLLNSVCFFSLRINLNRNNGHELWRQTDLHLKYGSTSYFITLSRCLKLSEIHFTNLYTKNNISFAIVWFGIMCNSYLLNLVQHHISCAQSRIMIIIIIFNHIVSSIYCLIIVPSFIVNLLKTGVYTSASQTLI